MIDMMMVAGWHHHDLQVNAALISSNWNLMEKPGSKYVDDEDGDDDDDDNNKNDTTIYLAADLMESLASGGVDNCQGFAAVVAPLMDKMDKIVMVNMMLVLMVLMVVMVVVVMIVKGVIVVAQGEQVAVVWWHLGDDHIGDDDDGGGDDHDDDDW